MVARQDDALSVILSEPYLIGTNKNGQPDDNYYKASPRGEPSLMINRLRLYTMSEQEYNHIVRLAGHDIDGQEILLQGIAKVKGVGLRMSKTILKNL